MAENTESKGPLPTTGTFDPRSFDSTHPYPVRLQAIQPYNATVNQRRSACVRFLYAAAIAALVWFMGATLLRSIVPLSPWPVGRGNYPIPPHVTPQDCVSYDEWSTEPPRRPAFGFISAAAASFDLPLSAENVFLLSRGPDSPVSSVEIVTSAEQDQGKATMEVVVSYITEDARNDAKVCRVLSTHGGLGVGIFTRQWLLNGQNSLHFATKVTLPQLSSGSPLSIKKFETDVHNTAHRVGDLNGKVLFQYLRLIGTNAPIDVESVQAHQGSIETSNAGISGVFNSSSSLVLTTRNGPVVADIGLSSIDASNPTLVVATTNAALTSRISLISEKGPGGTFDVTTSTTNEPLAIDFPAAPVYSILKFEGNTTNARVSVSLNPAYEGSFILNTTNAKPEIDLDESVIDPSGRDRKRSLKIKQEEKGITLGDVFWGDATGQKGLKGSVAIHTRNEPIELNL